MDTNLMEKLIEIVFLVVKIVGVFIAIIVILAISYCSYMRNPPSDEWFKENYYIKKLDFEKLREKVCAIPNLKHMKSNGTYNAEVTLDSETVNDIIKLMKDIGSDFVQVAEGCALSVSIWGIGFGGDGVYKKYAFNEDFSDRKLVLSTDEINKIRGEIKEPTFYTLKLDNGWSVSYDVWP